MVDDELLSLEQLVRNMEEEEEQEQLRIQENITEKQEAKVEKPVSSLDQQEGGIGKHGAGMDRMGKHSVPGLGFDPELLRPARDRREVAAPAGAKGTVSRDVLSQICN